MDREELKGLIYTIATEHLTNAVMDARQKILSEFDRLQARVKELQATLEGERGIVGKEVFDRVQDYLDSQKPRSVSEYRNGIVITHVSSAGDHELHIGAWQDCPTCNPKPKECSTHGETKYFKDGNFLCARCLKPIYPQPCPDCSWGQRRKFYPPLYYPGDKKDFGYVIYEPCLTCGGKRVVEEGKHV
jgi:hypothetical protein